MATPARNRGFDSPAETRSKTRDFEDNSQSRFSEHPGKPVQIHDENRETEPIGRRILRNDEDTFRVPCLRVRKQVARPDASATNSRAYVPVSMAPEIREDETEPIVRRTRDDETEPIVRPTRDDETKLRTAFDRDCATKPGTGFDEDRATKPSPSRNVSTKPAGSEANTGARPKLRIEAERATEQTERPVPKRFREAACSGPEGRFLRPTSGTMTNPAGRSEPIQNGRRAEFDRMATFPTRTTGEHDTTRRPRVREVANDPGKPIEAAGAEDEPARAGPILAMWMILTVILQAVLWVSGARSTDLADAVEVGAARAESRGIGEVGDEVVRKAIALQHDTKPFWTVLALLGDFIAEPLGLALRAGIVAALFAGIALARGRPVEFSRGLAGCAAAQGFWVLGLAVRVGLTVALRRVEVETSPTLLLPPGTHPGAVWLALRQLDVFSLIGWFAMARGGWARGQVRPVGALVLCAVLFLIEAIVRLQFSLVIEAGMRLSLLPEY